MKFVRAIRRRYGMASRTMAVRTHVAWHWRGLFMALALSSGVGLAWWMYDIGSIYAGFDKGASERELEQFRAKVARLELENGRLESAQVKTERHSQIDTAAQQDLQRDLKTLQDENASLKEEVAFFRGMVSGERAEGVNIYRFTVEREEAGSYRYQLLLVQAGKRDHVFQGRLQLVVTALEGAKKTVLTIPGAGAGEKFAFRLKSYQRLEGILPLPPAAVVKSVEARIFGEGSTQPKLTKIVSLS